MNIYLYRICKIQNNFPILVVNIPFGPYNVQRTSYNLTNHFSTCKAHSGKSIWCGIVTTLQATSPNLCDHFTSNYTRTHHVKYLNNCCNHVQEN